MIFCTANFCDVVCVDLQRFLCLLFNFNCMNYPLPPLPTTTTTTTTTTTAEFLAEAELGESDLKEMELLTDFKQPAIDELMEQ